MTYGPTPEDLVERRFGKWIVLQRGAKRGYWFCRCECGTFREVRAKALKSGETRSCGICYDHGRKHGLCGTRIYSIWWQMVSRYQDQQNRAYPNYGGRGIRVCERWLSVENFVADMGPRPSLDHSLDRTNNDGNYEPSNCRWATRKEQALNTRRAIWWTFRGEKLSLREWSLRTMLPYDTLRVRVGRYGWGVDRALTTPLHG